MRTLIKNGLIVRTDGVFHGDLLMDDGRILELGEALPEAGAEVVEAEGSVVMPGGVDVHTHLDLTVGTTHVNDGVAAGSLAAVWGGTTTVVEHPGFGPEGCPLEQQIELYRANWKGQCFADYAFHGVLQRADADVLAALPRLVAAGVPSHKAYMTYDGRLDDEALLNVLDVLGKAGGLLTVHAENHAMTHYLAKRLQTAGKTAPTSHPLSRSAGCEAEAVNRVLALAEAADAPIYLVHVSAAASLPFIRAAKAARGSAVMAETCPQYLLLTEERYADADGLQYVMAPPLRTARDNAALWDALADGTLDVVATDHCAFSLEQKVRQSEGNVFRCPGGVAGVETRLPLLYTMGVLTSRLTLPRFVDVCATRPSDIMGLPHKGRLAPGADADVVVLDPTIERKLTPDTLHQATDATPFGAALAGNVVRGWPRHVWLRGQAVIRDEALAAETPLGQEQPRM